MGKINVNGKVINYTSADATNNIIKADNGKYYQKEDAYIFDFAPERTLMVYDEFANSLYSPTAAGGGTHRDLPSGEGE